MPPKLQAQPYVAPKSDAYTGILFVSLLALIGGSALLYLDWSQYKSSKPPAVPSSIPRPGAAPAGGAGGAGGAAGAAGAGGAAGAMGAQGAAGAMGAMGGQAGAMGAMGAMGGKP